MMFKLAYKKLINSQEYKKWLSDHPNSYLAYGFVLVEDPTKINKWEIGFYDKDTDKLDLFVVSDKIELREQKEIFKKPGETTLELKLDFPVDLIAAIKEAKQLQEKKYKTEKPMKIISIIQHIDVGTVYNISFITQTFKTLNIKIDAHSGEILDDHLVSIFDIQPGKGGKKE